ncbi:MAG TPA: aminopeptidase [Atribacteraceae bacterium]|nr:aminopeptidase [Atribacteraceae bacterium]
MSDSRLGKLAEVLVTYSTEVKPGERVFIMSEDAAIPYIEEVAMRAIRAGAVVETVVSLEAVFRARLREASEEALDQKNLIFSTVIEHADVFLSAWGGWNTRARMHLEPDRIRRALRADAETRRMFSERMGNGRIRWCGTQYPTHADGQEAGMSLEEYQDFVYTAGMLDQPDPVAAWKDLAAKQERWVRYLNRKSELHIVSAGTDIRVGIGGRRWINCCGKVNFPDGEIFTSPVEDRVEGMIRFNFPGIFQGREIEGIELEVKQGKIVRAGAVKGEELLRSLLGTDAGSALFGEVAIGTNENITRFTRNMLFDEKIGGTVHMAVGDSMIEAGGKNRSSLHWDMLCDMRDGGRIYADGELFHQDGLFREDVLGGIGYN